MGDRIQSVLHQDDVGGLGSHVAARGSHRDTDPCLLQSGGVVHTVPHHADSATLGLKEIDLGHLVLGPAFRLHIPDPRLGGDAGCRTEVVPCE